MIEELLKAAQTEVENHSIYVWGGSGELCKDVSEAWIRAKESRNDHGKHSDDAVKEWEAVMNTIVNEGFDKYAIRFRKQHIVSMAKAYIKRTTVFHVIQKIC